MPHLPTDPHAEIELLHTAYLILNGSGELTDADAALIAAQVRLVLLTGARQLAADNDPPGTDEPVCGPVDVYTIGQTQIPPVPGFCIAHRVAALGYALTDTQAAALLPKLEQLVREEWTRRYEGVPMATLEGDWYLWEDQAWVDPILQAYLTPMRGLARTPGLEHLRGRED